MRICASGNDDDYKGQCIFDTSVPVNPDRMPMNSSRTARALLSAIATLFPAVVPVAAADYPAKPIRIVMPNSAGAATDTVARILAAKLTEVTSQQIIIDNRPGGGGVIGMEAVKN